MANRLQVTWQNVTEPDWNGLRQEWVWYSTMALQHCSTIQLNRTLKHWITLITLHRHGTVLESVAFASEHFCVKFSRHFYQGTFLIPEIFENLFSSLWNNKKLDIYVSKKCFCSFWRTRFSFWKPESVGCDLFWQVLGFIFGFSVPENFSSIRFLKITGFVENKFFVSVSISSKKSGQNFHFWSVFWSPFCKNCLLLL